MLTQDLLEALHEPDKIAQLIVDLKILQEIVKNEADVSNPDINLTTEHIAYSLPLRLTQQQSIDSDKSVSRLSRELMSVGSFFKLTENLQNESMANKGTINHISDIKEVGLYSGTNVATSPADGLVMIMVNKDDAGNISYMLTDTSRNLYVGFKPTAAENPEWNKLESALSKTYDYVTTGIADTGNPITIQSDAYEEVADLVTVERVAGVYEISFSATFKYDSTNRSALFQWSINGGSNWEQFRIEPKDANDLKALSYVLPITHDGGVFDVRLMAACEEAIDTLTIDYANIIIERKK